MSGASNRGSIPHYVVIVETGGIETPWRTWAECQSCNWKGPERVTPKAAEQDAHEHEDERDL